MQGPNKWGRGGGDDVYMHVEQNSLVGNEMDVRFFIVIYCEIHTACKIIIHMVW